MHKEELQAAYKRLILPENKAPYHFDERTDGTTVEAYNPMCGDKFKLYLSEVNQRTSDWRNRVVGADAIVWEGDTAPETGQALTRDWLDGKASRACTNTTVC